jgi:hypothetical protein
MVSDDERSTGPGAVIDSSHVRPARRGPKRTESGRSRQAGLQAPPADRGRRDRPGGVLDRRESPRRHPVLPLLDAVPPVRGRVAGPDGGPILLFDHGGPAATARRATRNAKDLEDGHRRRRSGRGHRDSWRTSLGTPPTAEIGSHPARGCRPDRGRRRQSQLPTLRSRGLSRVDGRGLLIVAAMAWTSR